MLIFYFLFQGILITFIRCPAYIEALNQSYPFRVGSHATYSFNQTNTFSVTIDPQLNYLPTNCFLGIDGYNNQIVSGIANTRIVSVASEFTTTSFNITSTIRTPAFYTLVSYSYAFFDPTWKLMNFYNTGFIQNSYVQITESMIDYQPLSLIGTVCMRSFEINYDSATSPYSFNPQFNGSYVNMVISGKLNYVYFDVTLVTYNTSVPKNSTLYLSWQIWISAIKYGDYGSLLNGAYQQSICALYFVSALKQVSWNSQNHISFNYIQAAYQDLMFKWSSNSSYNYYQFVILVFSIQYCDNTKFPYLLYRLQRCFRECPTNYYGDNSTKRCQPCDVIPNCTLCATASTCAKCNPSYNMNIDSNGMCVECNPDSTDILNTMPICDNNQTVDPVPMEPVLLEPPYNPDPIITPPQEPQVPQNQAPEQQQPQPGQSDPGPPQSQPQPQPQPQPEDEPQPQPPGSPPPQPQPHILQPDQNQQQQNSSQQQTPTPTPEQKYKQINPEDYSCVLNKQTTLCQASQITVTLTATFTSVASVPTLSLFTSAFTQLIGLFDDFSYYTYHNRIYSRLVEVYFKIANTFTVSRFFPTQLQSFVQKVNMSYSSNILHNDLKKTPPKFKQNDGDVYFLKNTETFFVGTLILSVMVFIIMAILNHLTNKCWKHKLLKRYSYMGMIIVSLLGGNIQYITFRCVEQLMQIVPLSPVYYLNLFVCYFMLFSSVLYSICGMSVFKSIYSQIKQQQIHQQLFDSCFNNWFIISNLLKLINGFVHAYFYNNPFLQQGILAVSYGIKAFVYLSFVNKIQQKLVFILELICNFAMFVFQSLIFAELFLIIKGEYTSLIENNIGQIEYGLLMILFVVQLITPIIVIFKEIVITLKKKFCYKPKKNLLESIQLGNRFVNKLRNSLNGKGNRQTDEFVSQPDELQCVSLQKPKYSNESTKQLDRAKSHHCLRTKRNKASLELQNDSNSNSSDMFSRKKKIRMKQLINDDYHCKDSKVAISSITHKELIDQYHKDTDNKETVRKSGKLSSQLDLQAIDTNIVKVTEKKIQTQRVKFKPREGINMNYDLQEYQQ